jgi:hypothetical protein
MGWHSLTKLTCTITQALKKIGKAVLEIFFIGEFFHPCPPTFWFAEVGGILW